MTRQLPLIAAIACLFLLSHGSARADDEAARTLPLRFRRIFVPAGRAQDWPTGNERYVPIDAQEFARLLGTAQASGSAPRGQTVQLTKAEYEARLVNHELLTGSARLEVSHPSVSAGMLSLEPCNLAIHEAHWQDRPDERVALGIGPDGRMAALVTAPGQLRWEWSLRGERNATPGTGFHLNLPTCPSSALLLDLPASAIPVCDVGMMTRVAGDGKGWQRWRIEMGGHSRLGLRIVSADSAIERSRMTVLRQSMSYEFSPRGIDVSAQLRLDVHHEPLERLVVHLDPSLKLVACRYGDTDIPWTVTTEAPSGASRITLELPEPVLGAGRAIRLSALAPLTRGSLWRLPGVRAEGVFWQEGTASLLIPTPLILERIATEGCRQSKTASLSAPLSGESIEVQYYSPAAHIDVVVGWPRERIGLDSGTFVELGPGKITSTTVAQLSLSQGEYFTVASELAPHWLVDNVECDAADNTADWNVESPDAKTRRLMIRLTRALSPKRRVRLVITGHRLSAVGEKLEAAALQMLSFATVVPGRQLMSLRAVDSHVLNVTGSDGLNRIDSQDLTAADRQLFEEAPGGLIFEVDQRVAGLNVSIGNRSPSYTAQLQVEALAQGKSVVETCSIRCVPDGSRVDHLVVQFSQPHNNSWQWSLGGRAGGPLSARLLSKAEPRPGQPPVADVELWEVSLRTPRTGPFEIRGVCTMPFVPDLALPLPSLLDATGQRGTITIRAQGETGLSIKNSRLKAIPADAAAGDRYPTARAAFRYEPGRDVAAGDRILAISPAPAAKETSGAWAWNCTLDSRYALASTAVHVATYRIQTGGQEHVPFKLPEDANLLGVWVDEDAVPQSLVDLYGDRFTVDLPSGRNFSTITLCFKTAGAQAGFFRSVRPPLPEVGIPVMSSRWTIWLPPGFELLDADPRCHNQILGNLTWSQRLFGPLGRGARGAPFNPLRAQEWLRLFGKDAAQDASRSALTEVIERLGARAASRKRTSGHLTWRQLLLAEEEREERPRVALLIDAPGLQRIDLNPDSRVDVTKSDSELERGLALLKQSNLTLLAHANAIVLTSMPAAALYRAGLSSTDGGATSRVLDGPLADHIEQAARSGESNRFLDAEQWISASERGRSPWVVPDDVTQGLADVRGWNAYLLDISDSSPDEPVRVVHIAGMRSLGWAIFLFVVGLGLWKPAGKRRWWLLAVALFGTAALLAPAAFTAVISPAFLGSLTAVAILSLRDEELPNTPRNRSSGRLLAAAPQTVALLLLGGAIFFAVSALAEDSTTAPKTVTQGRDASVETRKFDAADATEKVGGDTDQSPSSRDKQSRAGEMEGDSIYKVFVPIDAEQAPSGGKYFVPETLYDELYRREAAAREQPTGWLLERAAYQAALSRDPVQKKTSLSEIKAVFGLRVFQEGVRVHIPLGQGPAVLASVKLDGRLVQPEWDRDDKSFSFRVDERGAYHIELILKPSVQALPEAVGAELAIPKLPMATLELALPNDTTEVDVPLALGRVAASGPGAMVAQLGPSDTLSMRWPQSAGEREAQPNVEVDEFLWVKVQPGSMLARARFKFRVLEGQVRHLRLLADSRLRLLPSTDSDSPIAAIHTLPGDPETLDLELSEPVSDQVVVDLSFLLSGTTAIGNLTLPLLEAVDIPVSRRWLAISVDPGLRYQEPAGNELKSLSVADFTAAWGSGEIKAQMAYSLPRGEPKWVLATRPRDPQTTVDQTLSLGVGGRSTAVHFDAVLTTTAGYNFQLRVLAPADLDVESVSVVEDYVQRSARWSRGEDGLITIFLTGPVSGRQQLALRGRVQTAGRTAVPIPVIQVLDSELRKNQLHILRRPEVLVELQETKGLSEAEVSAPEGAQSELGNSVAAYAADGAVIDGKLMISPNAPRVEAVEVTSLEHDSGTWTAEVDYRLKVSDGLLDVLRFDIPAQWSEPFQLDRPASWEVRKVGDENRRQLVVRPKSSIGDQYRIKIRGRLALSAGDRVRVPDVRPRGIAQIDRFVVLPAQLEVQQIFWETFGLRKAQLPAEFRKLPISPESFSAYQVLGDHFQASLKSLERAAAPHVRLADISIDWQADGACHGVAVFDVEPAGASSCILQLPQRYRLLHASVDSLSALAVPEGAGRWRLSLGPQQLPQRIEVVFAGELTELSDRTRKRIEAPRLVALPVERTLWTICAPPKINLGQPAEDFHPLKRSQLDLFRLQSTATMLDLPAEVAAEQPAEEIARWYRRWKRRFLAARSTLKWHLAFDPSSANAEEEGQARNIDDQQKTAAKRLGVPETSGRSSSSILDAPGELLSALRTAGEPTLCTSRGMQTSVTLTYRPSSTGQSSRMLLLGLALVVALATVLLYGRAYLAIPTRAIILAGGLGWWLCLSPSVVGMLVFGAGLLSALGVRWARPLHVSQPAASPGR